MYKRLKSYATFFYGLGILCALLIFTRNTFGYVGSLKIIFLTSGALGLILSILQFRFQSEDNDGEFNLLYWLGSLVVYLGFVFQFLGLPYSYYILMLGTAVTAASFFINPFKERNENDEDLLDSE
jgi:hypothetical protein